ncbi:PREDICTED: protein FAM47A-like [Condylura cristata]|uniref:protein FAM47A-like n=1 Tax=Condylura cristata TaxID=143302 RepID=UPI000642AA30|nr:PREDICTED: protein FAM47A-like [Condylura cristata]
MADKKWLFGSGSREPMPLGMHCKPWYRDNLPSKCFAKHKVLKFPTSLDGKRWRFVREGLDDFRKGCPPCDDLITRGPQKGFLPVIPHKVPQPAPPKSHKSLVKDAGLFSKLSPAQLERKAFMADVDNHLTRHPLSVYPDLDADLPADLLLKVLQVLDPDRKLEDIWAYCEGTRERIKTPQKVCKTYPGKVYLEPPKKTPGICPDSVLRKEKKPRKKGSRKRLSRRRVPERVRDFCNWVAGFGDLGIDENFFMQLFDKSSECDRNNKVPHIKKIGQIPLELKYSMELNETDQVNFSIEETNWERKLQKIKDPYKPDREKIRYGAWYLKPKFWQKLINDEPLIDPYIAEGFGKPPTPDILEELYGTIAFKDYVLSKGYEMPSIIERLFTKKGWKYDSINTPMERTIRLHALKDDDDEEEEPVLMSSPEVE